MKKERVVTIGDVMLRLSTLGFERFTQAQQFNVTYAGSEANVAASVSLYGLPCSHVTRFPDNDLGRAAVQTLKQYGVDTQWIKFGDERIGIYFLENGAMQRSSHIVYDRFDSAFAHIQPGSVPWHAVLKDARWFHYTGITPALSESAAEVCLEALRVAQQLGITVSGDINYRRNLWQWGKAAHDVMPELIALTDVVVAGVTDMENCAAITGATYEEACEKFSKAFPRVQKITTTNRQSISSSHNRISAVMWTKGNLFKSKEYDLTHIVDRVGAGDAFIAGMIYALIKGKDDEEALAFAAAANAWKHSVQGDVNLATVEEIESLVKGENVGKLLR